MSLTDSLRHTGKVTYTESIMVSGRKFILVLVMLWLPLQGAIAAIMPLCVQAERIGARLDVPTMTAACDLHHDDGDQAGGRAAKGSTDSAPDNMTSSLSGVPCESLPCYASFSTLLPSAYSALIFTGGHFYAVSSNSRFTSFILQQPQRPPLA